MCLGVILSQSGISLPVDASGGGLIVISTDGLC